MFRMKLKSVCAMVALFAFGCMGLFVVPKSASASEKKIRNALNGAKKHARGLMSNCNGLRIVSKKACTNLQKARNSSGKFKRIRRKICKVSSAMPNICSRTSTYAYKVINSANKLLSRCLQCIGSGRCHSLSQVKYCKSYSDVFRQALRDFDRCRLKILYRVRIYNKAIRSLRRSSK